ncbi:hypothetical protein [Novipirellula rosea]|uniref:hypothetical protein n=1 Tax=Novipirellula rosea TaxID=1031540 RepID=UPI0031EB4EF6
MPSTFALTECFTRRNRMARAVPLPKVDDTGEPSPELWRHGEDDCAATKTFS